ncbi:glycoside hydrolase family 9 protein [Halobacteria archaeon AArc-m2/3/4]|uniref:Glycoside hydrolase family 9 protein n=1 Tax=Natronoglomus mannanivorans TaxID=2979990 RepID=A0AAP2YWU5_9EURY|nr:glycoside hydrolase family 9 protein [Halobacteria archaeon AArc-xg1-1]MCU4973710.1 glycoside hydrolase family 9 protein [Halobacteria archaeon AArc-m2/3/4]
MERTQQRSIDRRSILKAVGGIAATTAIGSSMTGTAFAGHDDEEYRGIRVNQVGYPLDGGKRAILTSQAMDVESVTSFEIVDADTGETVDQGSLSAAMDDEFGTNHTVKWADFTELDEPGEYRIVAGDEESYPFRVDEASAVYAELLRDVGRLYTLKRSKTHIDDPYTGLDIGPGHGQDEEAIVAEPADGAADFLAEEDVSPGDTIDVSAGWYDAGDYGKYVNPQAITVAQLLLAYERNPEAFHVGQFYIPDSVDDPNVGEMPDVLVESKYALRFLEQMQRSSGALFYKVAGNESFPPMDVAPEEDDQERYVFGHSSAGTAHACGAFAMAARVYEDHDPAFAQEMLECAEAAWEWLSDDENADLVWEQSRNQDEGSGAYGRAGFDEPDRYWAAAELLRTTGDDSYDQWIQDTDLSWDGFDGAAEVPGDVEGPIDWNNPVGLGQYAYYQAGGALGGTGQDDEGSAAAGLTSPFWVGQRYVGDPAADVHDVYTTGVYDFYWGHLKSGISRGVQGLWAKEVYEDSVDYSPHWYTDEEFSDTIAGPLHHALGRSATGHSFVTGHGEKSATKPHDRIVQSTDTLIPGMLVGGGHNNVFPEDGVDDGDCTSDHIEGEDLSHLMSYVDEHCSYATNEWAINYTAPLFMMLAEIVGEIDETPEPELADSGPSGPTAPADQWTNEVTETSIEMGWDSVAEADTYRVYLDGTLEEETSATTATITGLEAGTTYEIGLSTVVSGEESDVVTTAVTTQTDGDGPPSIDGYEPADTTGDGLYNDITGSGQTTTTDVNVFFENVDEPGVADYPQYYDFDGNGQVSVTDVVELFESI